MFHPDSTANHSPFAAIYADATARGAATGFERQAGGGTVPFDSTDINKAVLQQDDNSVWILTDDSPITWVQVAGNDFVPAHASSHENGGSDEINVAGLSGVLADPQVPITENVQDIVGAFFADTGDIDVTYDDVGNALSAGLTNTRKETILGWIIDGGGSTITTGVKGDLGPIPFNCTILEATLLADVSGSIVVNVWKDTYANFPPTVADKITASAPPTISSADKSTDSTLTGWTTTIDAGDILRFNVDSVSTIGRCVLVLKVRRT